MSLPTYQHAVTKPFIIDFVAPYLSAQDLASASRVSKPWEKACAPHLWGDPLKFLATMTAPFNRAYGFLELARTIRHERSRLIRTLDFRPLLSLEPRSENDLVFQDKVLNGFYILEVCRDLDNVLFLVMDGITNWELPHVYSEDSPEVTDSLTTPGPTNGRLLATLSIGESNLQSPHTSTNPNLGNCPLAAFSWYKFDETITPDIELQLAMRPPSCQRHSRCRIVPSVFSLRGCRGIDGMRIVSFPAFLCRDLTFLDLSYTTTSESWVQRFSTLSFPHLRVLKLRGLRLTDSQLPNFLDLDFNTHKVWSLDLRDNLLTNRTLFMLQQNTSALAVPPNVLLASPVMGPPEVYQPPPRYFQDSPELQGVVDQLSLRSDATDAYIKQMATNPYPSYMNVMEPLLSHTGLTHLYLSGNKFKWKGFFLLIKTLNSLQVLDIGNIEQKVTSSAPYKLTWGATYTGNSFHCSVCPRLSSLRIHHSMVTGTPTISDSTTPPALTSYSPDYLYISETLGTYNIKQGQHATFSPLDNCALETLTLTGIPTKSNGHIINMLLEFLVLCRQQEDILNRAREKAKCHTPPIHPGLRTLRLEFVGPSGDPTLFSVGGASVSGDSDANEFTDQSRSDFSFFSAREREAEASNRRVQERYDQLQNVADALRKAREKEENKWSGKVELVFT